MRSYRVSNVLDLTVLDETFERVTPFDLAGFWRGQLADFDRRRLTTTARVRVSPALVERLPDLGDHALSAAVAAGRVDADGWTRAELAIESPDGGAVHLIRYGGDMQVLAPDDVRAAVIALARAALAHY
jgi:predicted DNA-binding transcriptional regulator YafY